MTRAEWYRRLKPALIEHAAQRLQRNYGPGGRRWGEHTEEAAAEGEAAFAELMGGEPDLNLYDYGDGGKDQLVLCRRYKEDKLIMVDVKGVWKTPHYLVVPSQEHLIAGRPQIGVVRPDKLYVLTSRPPGQGPDGNEFIWDVHGCMWGDRVMTYPADFFMGNDKHTHMVPREELRPMAEFMAMYLDRWCDRWGRMHPAAFCDDNPYRGAQHERMAGVPQSGDHRDAPLPGR